MTSLGVKMVPFDAHVVVDEEADSNESNTVEKILSRFEEFENVQCPVLCKYLRVSRSDRDHALFIFSEHSGHDCGKLIGKSVSVDQIRRIGRSCFEALCTLSSLGVVHRAICPEAILLSENNEFIGLADWGFSHACDGGRLIRPAIKIGHSRYNAPECFCDRFLFKSDVFSVGLCLLELLLQRRVFETFDAVNVMKFCGYDDSEIESEESVRAMAAEDYIRALMEPVVDKCSKELRELILNCLKVDPCERWDCRTALRSPLFAGLEGKSYWAKAPYVPRLSAPSVEELYTRVKSIKHSREPSLDSKPEPIGGFSTPNSTQELDGGSIGSSLPVPDLKKSEEGIQLSDLDLVEISNVFSKFLTEQRTALSTILPEIPSLSLQRALPTAIASGSSEPILLSFRWENKIFAVETDEARKRAFLLIKHKKAFVDSSKNLFETFKRGDPLPSLDQRERDVGYQRARHAVFKPLLKARNRNAVVQQAAIDVPPSIRVDVWKMLLGIPSDEQCEEEWKEKSQIGEGPSDHQIEVDVPRCNARHETIGTPEGRRRLTKILKVWVACNPSLEYWQGLDSLSAPFVALSFLESEAIAFCMLENLVKKFLTGMFLQKNTSQLQTQLIIFQQLLSYHDPRLFLHLNVEQEFKPELYAIPWFLTLFTHILPIESTFRLWDFLFLHDATMIHFISIAVMRQIRQKLLSLDFNDLVLFFSELHSSQSSTLDMEVVIGDAVKFSKVTPRSLCTDHFVDESSNWWSQGQTLEELSENHSPKLSVEDLILLLKEQKKAVVVFDCRPEEEYKKGHFDGAINVPSVKQIDLQSVEELKKKKVIFVVIAERSKQKEFCNFLVSNGTARVCYLNGGVDALVSSRIKLVKE